MHHNESERMFFIVWCLNMFLICSSYGTTDFVMFNDVLLSVVNYSTDIFEVLIDDEYRQFDRADYPSFLTNEMFVVNEQYIIISIDKSDQVLVLDLETQKKLTSFNKPGNSRLAARSYSNDIWNIDYTIRPGKENLLRSLYLNGSIKASTSLGDASSSWTFETWFFWQNDTFICYSQKDDPDKSSFIIKLDYLEKNGTNSLSQVFSGLELGSQGVIYFHPLFFRPDDSRPYIFMGRPQIKQLAASSFWEILGEMNEAVGKCRKSGQSSDNLFTLTSFLLSQRGAANCNNKDELIIFQNTRDWVPYRFSMLPENIIWFSHRLDMTRIMIKDSERVLKTCRWKESELNINCDRNITLNSDPDGNIRFVDTRKGLYVIPTLSGEAEFVSLLECFNFIGCLECITIGYYNPCVWNGFECKEKTSNLTYQRCFNASSVDYEDLSDEQIKVTVVLPYELDVHWLGDKAYLELQDGSRKNVSNNGDIYTAIVSSSELGNISINIIRPTGGPMRIPLSDRLESPPSPPSGPGASLESDSSDIWLVVIITIIVLISVVSLVYISVYASHKTNDELAKSQESFATVTQKASDRAKSKKVSRIYQTQNPDSMPSTTVDRSQSRSVIKMSNIF